MYLKSRCAKLAAVIVAAAISLKLCGCTTIPKDEYTDTRFLMDTVCTIRIAGKESKAAADAAFKRISDIADKVDVFSDTSDTARINSAEAGYEVEVSYDTAVIIKTASEIYEASYGAFDITTGVLKDIWRFSDGNHMPPDKETVEKALTAVDGSKIRVDGNIVIKADSDIKIDLGAAAKGYALDCAKDVIKTYDVDYALIDLGGSISAVGDNPARKNGDWIVGLQKPFGNTGEYSQTVEINDEAVVTSGIYQRYFTWEGKNYHHIIDPKSGYPSENGISAVTVICDSGLLADCLSTAYMVMGEEKGNKLAEKYNVRVIVQK